ncbi:MAG: hypothetical protein A2Z16_04870 [Chloroflexi bacterium RBG_16_54_18]|nr:MAG: hypothetical protein A2Z16_04870 [Chloroflexi bacterium RBG_16_54_18]
MKTDTSGSNVIAIIQARLNSNRLPGKVLLDIAGKPMLTRVVERTSLAKSISSIVVVTTTDPSDEAIVELCEIEGYPIYRGSQFDVLDRYYQAAKQFGAEIIVRITADCPVIDPTVIDKTVNALVDFMHANPGHAQDGFSANRLPPPWGRTYPVGLDTEVCTIAGLELAWREARLPHQREHVMPFFYENPGRFNIIHVNHEADFGHLRWTVDTPQDLELIRQIFSRFPGRLDFNWLEVLDLIEREPDLLNINKQVQPKHYRQVDERGYH